MNGNGYNRRIAVLTSLGIACGIALHVCYSLAGIGFLIAGDEQLLCVLTYLAASYFAWQYFRAKKSKLSQPFECKLASIAIKADFISEKAAFFTGFFVNGLNVRLHSFLLAFFQLLNSTPSYRFK